MPTKLSASLPMHRQETVQSHIEDVERVIAAMHAHLSENLPMTTLADIALMSPFHFNRVFSCITGLPPCKFLWMLRIEAAKKQLLNSDCKVIDVCYDVGYDSLGTFTRRFTQLIGMPPNQFRHFANSDTIEQTLASCCVLENEVKFPTNYFAIVTAPEDFNGIIMLGLFRDRFPYEAPVSCTCVASEGAVRLEQIPNGRYFLFAAAFHNSSDPRDYLLSERILRGSGSTGEAVFVKGGTVLSSAEQVEIRGPRITDPPLLPCLPRMLALRNAAPTDLRAL